MTHGPHLTQHRSSADRRAQRTMYAQACAHTLDQSHRLFHEVDRSVAGSYQGHESTISDSFQQQPY